MSKSLPEPLVRVPIEVDLPCGATAEFDYGAGYGYRCTTCNAVYGSIGMPRSCREAMEQSEVVAKLRGIR